MTDRFICPDCRKRITNKERDLVCNNCRRKFKIFKGIPILLPKRLSGFKKIEIDFYEKEFSNKQQFDFVEKEWKKDSFGLLDFMEIFDNLPKNASILEIGAGNGQYSLILNKKGFSNTTTSDISIVGLIAAKKYSKNKGRFIVSDSESIPFEDNTFDVVFLTAALHHFPDPQKAISEMKRCVKNGGSVIAAVEPNSWYYHIVRPIAKLLRIRRIDGSKDSFSMGDEETSGFSMRKLKRYFRQSNLDILETQRVWYLTGLVFYFPEFMKRTFNMTISINPGFRRLTLNIDRFIGKIPLLRDLSFHNTVIGVKK